MRTLIVAVALLVSSVAMAQPGPGPGPGGGPRGKGMRNPERKDQIDAQRSAYITSRIGLTNEQSQAFWPLFNRFRDEMEQNRKSFMKTIDPKASIDDKSDADLKEAMDARFRMEEEKLKIEKRYHQEFLKVISLKQVAKLYRAEEEFKREILREIKRRR